MTPYKQLNWHDPDNGVYGDCFRTSIGCLLDLPPAEVPHFVEQAVLAGEDHSQGADKRARDWLAERGFAMLSFNFLATPEWVAYHGKMAGGVPYLLTGQSPNYDCLHTVVGIGAFEVLHDVSTAGKGIAGPWKTDDGQEFYSVDYIVPLNPMTAAA